MPSENTTQQRLGAALFYGVVALLAYLSFLIIEPVLKPLVWAAIVVAFFYPAHARLARRWKAAPAAAVSTAAVMLILIVPLTLVGFAFVRQAADAVSGLQQTSATGLLAKASEAWLRVQQRYIPGAPTDLTSLLRSEAEKFAGSAAAEAGAIFLNIVVTVFDFAVMLLATYYFFRDADSVMKLLRRALPFDSETKEKMLRGAKEMIFASVMSSLVGAGLLGAFGAILFAATGVRQPIFWGVMAGFCSFVPAIGSAVVWVPAGIWLLAHGHLGRGIFLLAAFAALGGVVDNLVRPWLIRGRARLNELVIFVSILGGIAVFGMLGIVLGPIVVAMAASVLDLYAQRRSPGTRSS